MKLPLFLVFALWSITAAAQLLTGAWKRKTKDGSEVIKICVDNYFMEGALAHGKFNYASGGRYLLTGNTYTETYDFFTTDSTRVGMSHTYVAQLKGDLLILSDNKTNSEEWERVDKTSTSLTGSWRFGARVDDNGVAGERRSVDAPRQTIKILSGKYFQWAAFNRETKQFMGTGGGTYTLADGKYTENIRFFSRDNTRSGMSLTFDCRLDGNDWYHKGKGTTGNPVSEVWERMVK